VKQFLKLLRYLLFLGIGILLLWLSFRNQSFSIVWDKIRHADLFWVFVSIALGILALIIRAIRWKQLIEPLGYQPGLYNTYNSVMVGYLANMAIPRLGEISRCGALSRAEKVPFDKLIGTVIVERVSDVLMLVISILFVGIMESGTLSGFLLEKVWAPLQNGITTHPLTFIVAGILFLAGVLVLWYLFRMKNPPKIVGKIVVLIKGVIEGLKSIRKLRSKGMFIFYSCAIWILYLLMTYVCFFALPATSGLDIGAGLFVTVLGGIGMTAPVQGGIGVYHLLVSQGLVLFGLSAADGIAFAMLVHTSQTLMLIILGFISLISLFFFSRKKIQPDGSL
jgi:glycosyltransferase 2 family protein